MKKGILFFQFFLMIYISTASSCISDSDCSSIEVCIDASCEHKPLFPNVQSKEIAGFIVLFIFSIITTIAGIGGGVVFFPILMIMFNFTTQDAVPISITMVFLILFLRNLLCFSERHPFRDKSVINYDISLIFSPANIIGNIFGVIINKVSASWLILILIVALMSINVFFTAQKALELRKKSKDNKASGHVKVNLTKESLLYLNKLKTVQDFYVDSKQSQNVSGNISEALLVNENDEIKQSIHNSTKLLEIKHNSFVSYQLPLEENNPNTLQYEQVKTIHDHLEKILNKEKRMMDYEKVLMLVLNLVVLVIFNLFRGNKNFDSILGIPYCSAGFWVFQFLYIPFGLLFLWFAIKILNKEYKEKKDAGYVFHKSDLKWDKLTCFQISLNGLVVGLISSILGIGGAIVTAPLLLKIGVETQEASFTASFLALFSSIASVIQYLLIGKIKWDYAGFCGGLCLVGMILGLKGVLVFLKKMNMIYLIVFVLVFMILVATILNVYSNINELVNNVDSRSFHSYC